jgi:NucS shadow ORF
MSLSVPTAVLERAQAGAVDDHDFVGVVRDSLPYRWSVVSAAVEAQRVSADGVGEHEVSPPGEAERGQLLRALASDAIRGGLQPLWRGPGFPELPPGRRVRTVACGQ